MLKKNNIETNSSSLVRILKQSDKAVLLGEKSSNKWKCKRPLSKKKQPSNPKNPKQNPKQTPTNAIMNTNILHLHCFHTGIQKPKLWKALSFSSDLQKYDFTLIEQKGTQILIFFCIFCL